MNTAAPAPPGQPCTAHATPLFERASKAIAAQSFTQLLGASLEVFEPGRAEMSLPVTPKLLQQHGFVHGGVVAYLADNTLTLAGGTVLENVVTGEMKLNYLRPVTNADSLLAIATVVGHGKTQAVCRCDVFIVKNGERKLCAAAQGTINKLQAPMPMPSPAPAPAPAVQNS